MTDLKEYEVWFVTGSQHLYGEAALKEVAEHSRKIAEGLSRAKQIPVKVIFKPVVTTPEAIYEAMPGGEQYRKLHRPDHLDAHFFTGEDVDRGIESAAKTISSTCIHNSTGTCPGRPSTWIS